MTGVQTCALPICGIHVDAVELVIHWDIAMDPKDYVHRSGRTARAGSAGTVISLVTDRQVQRLTRITKQASISTERTEEGAVGRVVGESQDVGAVDAQDYSGPSDRTTDTPSNTSPQRAKRAASGSPSARSAHDWTSGGHAARNRSRG